MGSQAGRATFLQMFSGQYHDGDFQKSSNMQVSTYTITADFWYWFTKDDLSFDFHSNQLLSTSQSNVLISKGVSISGQYHNSEAPLSSALASDPVLWLNIVIGQLKGNLGVVLNKMRMCLTLWRECSA